MSQTYRPQYAAHHQQVRPPAPPPVAAPPAPPIPAAVANQARQPVKNLVNQIATKKDSAFSYFQDILSKVDKQSMLIGVGIVTTLGIGGFTAYYIYKRNAELKKRVAKEKVYFQVDGHTSTPVKVKSTRSVVGDEDTPSPGALVLHQCPRGRRTPCIAPYPLKLETFLRVHGINYEVDFNSQEPRTQGSPWITADRIPMGDSATCMKYLVEHYKIDDGSPESKDTTHAVAYNHLLENHLYWGIALWRWVYDGAKSLPDIQIVSKMTMQMIPEVTRTVEQAAWFHGIGKQTQPDVLAAIHKDIKALSDFLGQKKFFLGGERATELDCTAFAMLSQILWNMDNSPFHQDLKSEKYKNLSDFCWRMRVRYWPDWEDCLNNTELVEDTNNN